MRALLALLACLTVAFSLAFRIRHREPAAAATRSEPGLVEREVGGVAEVVGPVAIRRPGDAGRRPVAPERVEVAPTPAPAAPASLARVRGTIDLVDEAGVLHTTPNGSLDLLVLAEVMPGGMPTVTVEVTGGRWSLEHEGARAVSVRSARLEGRTALVDEGDELKATRGGPVELHARLPERDVVDARTGRALNGVELLRVTAGERRNLEHPGVGHSTDETERHAASPIAIEPDAASGVVPTTFFARTDGHAWGRIKIDTKGGGERFLHLVPGGSLAVTVGGDRSRQHLVFRLRESPRTGGPPQTEIEMGQRTSVELESVAPGTYRASLEVGEWYREPVTLASAEVVVEAGVPSAVRLHLETVPSLRRVPLSGRLAIPVAWDRMRPKVSAELLETPADGSDRRFTQHRLEPAVDAPNEWTWSVGPVLPGRYRIEYPPLGYARVVDVGHDGRTDVRLEIPLPGTVQVRVVDHRTRYLRDVEDVYWRCERSEAGDAGVKTANRTSFGQYEFRAPQGRVQVGYMDRDVRVRSRHVARALSRLARAGG